MLTPEQKKLADTFFTIYLKKYGKSLNVSKSMQDAVNYALEFDDKYQRINYNNEQELYVALDDGIITPLWNKRILISRYRSCRGKISHAELKRAFNYYQQISKDEINVALIAANRRKINQKNNEIDKNEQEDNEKTLFDLVAGAITKDGKFDPGLADQLWQQKKPNRESIIAKHGVNSNLDIQEKFLQNTLGNTEWMTDGDLGKLLTLFGLRNRVSIFSFTTENIAQILRLAISKRKKQEQPYVIPLLLNLGSKEYSSTGIHWTRALIFVNPINKSISVRYRDSMSISYTVKSVFTDALTKLQSEEGLFEGYTLNNKDIDVQKEQIAQGDGWNCGYRALKNLLDDPDFPYTEDDNKNADLTHCRRLKIRNLSTYKWSYRLRDETYLGLLKSIQGPKKKFENMKHDQSALEPIGDGEYRFRLDYITDYCRNNDIAFHDDWEELYSFAKQQLTQYKSSLFKAKDREDLLIDINEKLDQINNTRDKNNIQKSIVELLEVINAASVTAISKDIESDKKKDNSQFRKCCLFSYRNVTGSRFQHMIDKIRDNATDCLLSQNDPDLNYQNEFTYIESLLKNLIANSELIKVKSNSVINGISLNQELNQLMIEMGNNGQSLPGKIPKIKQIHDILTNYESAIKRQYFNNFSQHAFRHLLSDIIGRLDKFSHAHEQLASFKLKS